MNLDIISTIILFISIFWILFLNVPKFRNLSTSNFFCIFFIGGLMAIGVVDILFYLQKLSLHDFLKFRSMGKILIHAIVLGSVGLLSIEELTPKKVKTLWRIPVLGILLGFFNLDYHIYIQLSIALLTLFIFVINRGEIRILKGTILLHILLVAGLILIGDFNFWIPNLILVIYMLNISKLWDMMRLKQACTRIEP